MSANGYGIIAVTGRAHCQRQVAFFGFAPQPTPQRIKAMDDIGVIMTPFGDVVTVILVVNSYRPCRLILQSS